MRKWRGDPVNGWTFDRYWVYDGDQRVISFDPSGNRIEEYAYAPGIDRPIATIRGNTTVDAVGYHVQDELGNILGIIENGAYISQTLSYDAWGVPTETGHAYNNQLWWKSLKWEGDVISLYYVRNRWYDPETGRFMSEDPIGLAGGINMYTFANNDPVNGRDPYGLVDCRYVEGWHTWSHSGGTVTSTWNPGRWICSGSDGPVHGDGGGSGVGRHEGWPTGPGGGTGGLGGQVQSDATKVADPRAIAARHERLSCQRGAISRNTAAGVAVGRTAGAVVGLQRARRYAAIGGLVGGGIASLAGPEATPVGFYGGRIIGIGAAMFQGGSVGTRVGGALGATYGIGAASGCNAPALPWENQ